MSGKRKPVVDMSWQDFGSILLDTEDLDPVYVMLHKATLDRSMLSKFLLAYWCFYNCGVASYIAEAANYYHAMWKCLHGKAPRGMERRHFWGQQAIDTVNGLIEAGSPEFVVEYMCDHRDFWGVFNTVKSYRGFGPWMGFKIADMAERVLHYPVDFSTCTLGIYKDPRAGAAFIRFGDRYHDITDHQLSKVVDDIIAHFSDWNAPPSWDRQFNVQEAETILCKYKAHCYGAYPIHNDITHLRKAMEEFRSDLGDHLIQFIPE